jgi:hypothetical protein
MELADAALKGVAATGPFDSSMTADAAAAIAIRVPDSCIGWLL